MTRFVLFPAQEKRGTSGEQTGNTDVKGGHGDSSAPVKIGIAAGFVDARAEIIFVRSYCSAKGTGKAGGHFGQCADPEPVAGE